MKRKLFLVVLVAALSFSCSKKEEVETNYLGISTIDSLAMVKFYEAMHGDLDWDLADANTWSGVEFVYDEKLMNHFVKSIKLTRETAPNLKEGYIPCELGNLWKLESFVFQNISAVLYGYLPMEIFNCPLKEFIIDTGYQNIKGSFDESIGNIANTIETFIITNTNIEGELPKEFGDLKKLKKLYLAYNKFTGVIPASLGRLPMEMVALDNNNFIGVEWDYFFITDVKVCRLYVRNNRICGVVPEDVLNSEIWEVFYDDYFFQQGGYGFCNV